METGTGKTLTGLTAIAMAHRTLGRPSRHLILVPDTLLTHWASEIKKHTIWPSENIHAWRRSKDVTALESKCDGDFPQVFLISPTALRSKKLDGELPENFFDMMIVDEVQTFSLKTIALRKVMNWVMNKSINYTLFTSATPHGRAVNVERLGGVHHFLSPLLGEQTKFSWIRGAIRSAHTFVGTAAKSGAILVDRNVISLEPPSFVKKCHRLIYNLNVATLSVQASRCLVRNLERVCSGGEIDEELVLAVLERLVLRNRQPDYQHNYHVGGLRVVTDGSKFRQHASVFGKKEDGCIVCLLDFEGNNEREMGCGHVLCSECLDTMVSMTHRPKCPHCRTALKVSQNNTVYTQRVKWTTRSDVAAIVATSSSSSTLEHLDRIINDTRVLERVLDEESKVDMSDGAISYMSVTNLKLGELQKLIQSDFGKDNKTNRMVLFVHRDQPAQVYKDYLENEANLKVTFAGVFKTNKSDSTTNIESFRQDPSIDVIIMNYKYSTGFDLLVSHLMVMDFTRNCDDIIQAIGRVTRIGQMNPVINITIVTLSGCIDSFIFHHVANGASRIRFGAPDLQNLNTFVQLEDSNSKIRQIITVVEKIAEMPTRIENAEFRSTTYALKRELTRVSIQPSAEQLPDDPEARYLCQQKRQADIQVAEAELKAHERKTQKVQLRGSLLHFGDLAFSMEGPIPSIRFMLRNWDNSTYGHRFYIDQLMDVPLDVLVDNASVKIIRKKFKDCVVTRGWAFKSNGCVY
jgi:superfamily II DNA or RNA helicase